MKLSVLISTIDEGIHQVGDIFLEPRKDVEYVVSHQYTEKKFKITPPELKRDDVILSRLPGRGLSKSRNNAIKKATGDIALIADDDVRYKAEYFNIVINTFVEKEPDVACFKIKTFEGEPEYKNYPSSAFKIADFDSYIVSSIEIGFLIEKVRKKNIFFDERFGLGAKYIGGEETIFLNDCISNDLNVWFYPKYIVSHKFESSNKQLGLFDEVAARRSAAVRYTVNGSIELIKILGRPIKHFVKIRDEDVNPLFFFYYQISTVISLMISDIDQRIRKMLM